MTDEEAKKRAEERRLALHAANFCKSSLGMSWNDFEEAIEYCTLTPTDYLDACWALKQRGELDHLLYFVFVTWRKGD